MPELAEVIANLELMPLRMNESKHDKVGSRQRSVAKQFHEAGLLSEAGLNKLNRRYPQHVGGDEEPTTEYFAWAKAAWASSEPQRHPMGMEAKAAFHWWGGQRLTKVDARKRTHVPLYAEQVVKQPFFKKLNEVWNEDIKPNPERSLYLMDFDAYEYDTITLSQVLKNLAKSMGHGFVLAMLLTNGPTLRECKLR